MCNRVYLAADRPLPEVAWQPDAPGFHLEELPDGGNDGIRRVMSGSHLYYVGSWMGCGCGFSYWKPRDRDPEWAAQFEAQERKRFERLGRDYDDWQVKSAEINRKGRASVSALAAYLWEVVEDGPVQMLHCWFGKEGRAPDRRMQTTPSYFEGPTFRFGVDTILFVISAPRDGRTGACV